MGAPWQKPPLGTLLNCDHPLARGLVGAWLMNERSGNIVNDYSGNNCGLLFSAGMPVWDSLGVKHIATWGVLLDTLTNNSFPAYGGRNHTVVSRFIAYENTTNQYILNQNTNVADNGGIFWYITNTTKIITFKCYNTNGWGLKGDIPFDFGVLTSWASVQHYSTSSFKGYKNGVEYALTAGNGIQAGIYTSGFRTGRAESWDSYYGFNGIFNFIYFYSRALSSAEIAWLHREPYAMFEDKKIWTFSFQNEVLPAAVPFNIDTGGFAADGAFHIEADANRNAKITWDITRHQPAVVIHDYPMLYGASPGTDPLIAYWKCNDNAESTTIIDETGNYNGILAGGSNTSAKSSELSAKGTSIRLNGENDYINLSSSLAGLQGGAGTEFTISLKFRPNFTFDTGNDAWIMDFGSAYGDCIRMYYLSSADKWTFRNRIAGGNDYLYSVALTSSTFLQTWLTVVISVDMVKQLIFINLNGILIGTFAATSAWSASPNKWYIGTDIALTSSVFSSICVDEIKIYNKCILPFGAYETQYAQKGDYTYAHSDITFYWNGSDTTPIGSDVTSNGDYTQDGMNGNKAFRNDDSDANEYASVPTPGNIDATEGSMSFWVKPNTNLAADCDVVYAGTGFKIWWDDSDNDWVFTYNATVVRTTTAMPAADAGWGCIKITWKASTYLSIEVNGVSGASNFTTTVNAAPTLDATMYFTADDVAETNRADVMISELYITSKCNTPQVWTAFGTLIWNPLLRAE